MKLKIRIANESHLLKNISHAITDKLKALGVNKETIFDVRIAVEEALRNAMIHGNKLSYKKKVEVEAEISETAARICITDEGDGFDPASIPDPTDELNILKTSGRGVYIIKHLMDDVKYESGGKKIIMVKYLGRKEADQKTRGEVDADEL